MLITFSLKFLLSVIRICSIDNMDNAESRSLAILLRRKDLMRFKVEKHLSASEVDIGIVMGISRSFVVSEKVEESPLSHTIASKSTRPFPSGK